MNTQHDACLLFGSRLSFSPLSPLPRKTHCWDAWLEFPFPKQFMRRGPGRKLTTVVMRAVDDDFVGDVESARIDQNGERLAQHQKFVTKQTQATFTKELSISGADVDYPLRLLF
jgi:hypothetical protein